VKILEALKRLLFGTPITEMRSRCDHRRVMVVYVLRRGSLGRSELASAVVKCADCGQEPGDVGVSIKSSGVHQWP
jgi:hypothetical protein